MIVLGLAAFVHDSAACLIRDGKIVANAEEERFNREQHTDSFPAQAVAYVLREGNIQLSDVDVIAFNWHPWRSLAAEILKVALLPIIYFKVYRYSRPPKNFRSIFASLLLKRSLRKHFSSRFTGRIVWVDHHLAHAASSYYLAPFAGSPADIVVVDGHGDDSSASVYSVRNNTFTLQWKVPIFDSLGIVYSNVTRFLGFDSYQEGKTMALASYGRDSFSSVFEKVIALKPGGRYEVVNKKYLAVWNYLHNRLESEIGTRRTSNEPLEQRHFDVACSMQNRVKEAILHMIRHVASLTGHSNLGLSGGVFLNCDINRQVLNSMSYPHVFVPPFPSDSGGAAGAALYAACARGGDMPERQPFFSPYLGPAYSESEITGALEAEGLAWEKVAAPWEHAARALHEGRVVGWFQGRMECGPRALGNRSILANPTGEGIRDYLNSRTKRRELFRPFAPVVTREAAVRCFDLQEPLPELTRYMLVTVSVRPEFRAKLPGITHVDGTARVQVVTPEANPEMHRLLLEFEKLSGYAVLINTSFNCREPIVCSPADAAKTFKKTGLDLLCIGSCVVRARELTSTSTYSS